MIKAVIFDRDGVLANFDIEAGVSFFKPLLPISLTGLVNRWADWGQTQGFPSDQIEEQEFWSKFWNSLADEFTLDDRTKRRLKAFKYTTFMFAYPDAFEALTFVSKQGLKTGVLSNFSLASLEDSLRALKLDNMIDIALAAPVIGVEKPNPAAYLHMTKSLGVAPEECLFFDDELPNVLGARQLGMDAYLVDRTLTEHAIPNETVRDLTAVKQLLATDNNK